MKKPIAVHTITNCFGIAIYDVNDETALVGLNDEKPEWVDVKTDEDGRSYIDAFGGVYLDECIKV